jgi:hypothetical protein
VRAMPSAISATRCENVPPCEVQPAHAGLGSEGYELGVVLSHLASAQTVLFFGKDDDAAAFRGLVGEAGKLRGVGQFGFRHAVTGDEFDGLAIAERDGAGLVEKQGIDVAGGFDCFAAHGENIVLHYAVHACDTDGGKKTADGGRNQANEQRDEDDNCGYGAGFGGVDAVLRKGREGDDG